MTTNNRESIRPRLVGYTYEGGLDLDSGRRHDKRRTQARDNQRRNYTHAQRQRWSRDFPTEPNEY